MAHNFVKLISFSKPLEQNDLSSFFSSAFACTDTHYQIVVERDNLTFKIVAGCINDGKVFPYFETQNTRMFNVSR